MHDGIIGALPNDGQEVSSPLASEGRMLLAAGGGAEGQIVLRLCLQLSVRAG